MVAMLMNAFFHAARLLKQGHAKCFPFVKDSVEGKNGIEIGGPTRRLFGAWYRPMPIYAIVGALDNCVNTRETAWTEHADHFTYHSRKMPGRVVIAEGSDLREVPDGNYDFVVSSHNLEHFANPVKALKEWQRITRPGGHLLLVLPYYTRTFDHRRTPTKVEHMLENFRCDVQEDDLSHVQEVLDLHDLSRDRAMSFEQFRERCLHNAENRCLHHHVFDESNSQELLEILGMHVMKVELMYPYDLFVLAGFPS